MEEQDFQPRLNLFDAVMIVMGAIIGAGIFFTPQAVVREVESPGAALLVWLAGGTIALLGAATYAELGAMLPRAGGQYVFLREAYGGLVGFLYGWMLLLAIVSGAIAVVAVIFAQYLERLLPGMAGPWFQPVVATSLIAVLTLVNICGIRPGSWVQNVFTLLKILAILALAVAGFWRGSLGEALAGDPAPLTSGGSLAAAMAAVLFSSGGWQNLTYVAREVKEPTRNLPLAILAGVTGVTLLYLLANVAFLSLLSLPTMRSQDGFAAEAIRRAFGSAGEGLFAAAICCSTLGIINVLIMATPRVYYAMARDGVFFRGAGRLHARFRTPVLSILVQGIWPAILVLLVEAGSLLNYVVFADWVFFGLTGFSLIVLRRRGAHPVPFRSLGYPLVPLLFSLIAAAVVGGLLIQQWSDARFGLLILLSGIPVYRVWKARAARLG